MSLWVIVCLSRLVHQFSGMIKRRVRYRRYEDKSGFGGDLNKWRNLGASYRLVPQSIAIENLFPVATKCSTGDKYILHLSLDGSISLRVSGSFYTSHDSAAFAVYQCMWFRRCLLAITAKVRGASSTTCLPTTAATFACLCAAIVIRIQYTVVQPSPTGLQRLQSWCPRRNWRHSEFRFELGLAALL